MAWFDTVYQLLEEGERLLETQSLRTQQAEVASVFYWMGYTEALKTVTDRGPESIAELSFHHELGVLGNGLQLDNEESHLEEFWRGRQSALEDAESAPRARVSLGQV